MARTVLDCRRRCSRAEAAEDAYLPGYTHMQRAQPVLLAHHLLAHAWAFARDVDRLLDTFARLDIARSAPAPSPGRSLPLDPDGVAAGPRLSAAFENSLDAVSDRDFVAETLFDLALLGVHLSRMGEELVHLDDRGVRVRALDDAFATGSSMLPQKKNPDVAELARAKAGRLIGHLTGVLATLKGLPLAYNRDLQEDKEPLFDALDQVALGAAGARGADRDGVTFDLERMATAADGPAAAAVDLAEWLVGRGVPFREAHGDRRRARPRLVQRGRPARELVASPSRSRRAERSALLEPGRRRHAADDAGWRRARRREVQLERFQTPPRGRRPTDQRCADAARDSAARTSGRTRARPALPAPCSRRFYDDGRSRSPPCAQQASRRAARAGRAGIVEVEAYRGADDPASPRLQGPDPRNADHVRAAGPPLRLFHLRDALVRELVCWPEGDRTRCCSGARALEGRGRGDARCAAAARADRDLRSGPARLCQALGIDRSHDGADLVTRRPRAGPHRRRRAPPPERRRLGSGRASARPPGALAVLRYAGDPNVSKGRRARRAGLTEAVGSRHAERSRARVTVPLRAATVCTPASMTRVRDAPEPDMTLPGNG